MKIAEGMILTTFFLTVGISMAKAECPAIEDVCEALSAEGKSAPICNKPFVYINTGRSIFGSYPTMGGEIIKLCYSSSGKLTRMVIIVTKADNDHQTLCGDERTERLDKLQYQDSVSTLATIRHCR